MEHLRNFGDVLHSTIVVRHYRRTSPNSIIVWGISERYVSEFDPLRAHPGGPHYIVGLPHGPPFPDDGPLRVAWTRRAREYNIRVITPSVHPYGWESGSLSEAILANAGIMELEVPRRPLFPVDISDYAWNDQFLTHHQVRRYITIEYKSYSLKAHSIEWYAELVQKLKLPVVSLAGKNEELIPGTVDCRGCTYRQAKVTIMRSKCFVGCASGNGMVAVSEECDTPMVEIIETSMCMPRLGYISNGRKYRCTGWDVTPEVAARAINGMINED